MNSIIINKDNINEYQNGLFPQVTEIKLQQ